MEGAKLLLLNHHINSDLVVHRQGLYSRHAGSHSSSSAWKSDCKFHQGNLTAGQHYLVNDRRYISHFYQADKIR